MVGNFYHSSAQSLLDCYINVNRLNFFNFRIPGEVSKPIWDILFYIIKLVLYLNFIKTIRTFFLHRIIAFIFRSLKVAILSPGYSNYLKKMYQYLSLQGLTYPSMETKTKSVEYCQKILMFIVPEKC